MRAVLVIQWSESGRTVVCMKASADDVVELVADI